MSFLGVLGGIGSTVSNEVESRRQEQEQRKREEEMARKEKMDAFMKTFSLVDPEAKLQLLQTPDAQIAFGKNAGTVRDSFGRGIAQQQQAKMRGEGVAQLQQDIQSQVGAPDVPEGSAEMLYDAGKAGRGLDAIMNINRTIQNKQDARMSNRVNNVYDDAVASGNRAKIVSAAGQLKTMGFADKAKELMQIADTLVSDDAKLNPDQRMSQATKAIVDKILEGTPIDTAPALWSAYTGQEITPEQMQSLSSIAESSLMSGVKIPAEQMGQITKSIGIISTADNIAKVFAETPGIEEKFGPISGMATIIENAVNGGSKTPELNKLLFNLGVITDATARAQSGAALTAEEQEFYGGLVGALRDNPANVKANVSMLKDFFVGRIENIYRSNLSSKFTNPQSLESAVAQMMQLNKLSDLPVQRGTDTNGSVGNNIPREEIEAEMRRRGLTP